VVWRDELAFFLFIITGKSDYRMKKLILSALLLPLAQSASNSIEVRGGEWPINLERDTDRSGVSFSLIFRDQQVIQVEVLDTLVFADAEQLRYFGKGLTALKAGSNGDIAKFKDYSIKRADKKDGGGVWYILKCEDGITSFQQPEADIIDKTIKGW
jgi:hypothetical protein